MRIYIVWGLHERSGDKYYNAAVLLSPKGEILGTYHKVHINKYESNMGWTNGDRFQVWPCEIDGVSFNLGIMICFDREVPEAARCLAVLGADIIAIPQATGCTCDVPIHRDQLRVRAYENEVFIAMANWAGPEFKGHSMIIDADGTCSNSAAGTKRSSRRCSTSTPQGPAAAGHLRPTPSATQGLRPFARDD